MNKNELIKTLVTEKAMKKKDAKEVVNLIFHNIQDALQKGNKVKLHGFGNFEVRERAARKGRNPQTGETLPIGASKAPAFKPSKLLKKVVNK